jgi:hypothetical protein
MFKRPWKMTKRNHPSPQPSPTGGRGGYAFVEITLLIDGGFFCGIGGGLALVVIPIVVPIVVPIRVSRGFAVRIRPLILLSIYLL